MPSSLAAELKIMAGKRVYLNLSRQLQPLESYAIESLNMKEYARTKWTNFGVDSNTGW